MPTIDELRKQQHHDTCACIATLINNEGMEFCMIGEKPTVTYLHLLAAVVRSYPMPVPKETDNAPK